LGQEAVVSGAEDSVTVSVAVGGFEIYGVNAIERHDVDYRLSGIWDYGHIAFHACMINRF